jgi:hypothetical protein
MVVALAAVYQVKPLYLETVDVVLLRPAVLGHNAYVKQSPSLVQLTGVVARAIEGGAGGAQVVSSGVTLANEGIKDGFSVEQPNSGGQWDDNFESPTLVVQAIAPTPSKAKANMAAALDAIDDALTRLQDDQDVASVDRVRVSLTPVKPQLYVEQGSSVRALAATALVATIGFAALMAVLGPPRPPRAQQETVRPAKPSSVGRRTRDALLPLGDGRA